MSKPEFSDVEAEEAAEVFEEAAVVKKKTGVPPSVLAPKALAFERVQRKVKRLEDQKAKAQERVDAFQAQIEAAQEELKAVGAEFQEALNSIQS